MSFTNVSQPPQWIKQCCGIERAQARKAVAQENHSLYALLSFLRLEVEKWRSSEQGSVGISQNCQLFGGDTDLSDSSYL